VLLPNPGQPRELTGNFWIQEIKYENNLPIIMDEPVPAIDETTTENILEYRYFVDPANEGEVHWRAKAESGSGPGHGHPVCYVSGQHIVMQPVIRFPRSALKLDDWVCLIGIRVMRNASGDVTGRNVFTKPTIEESRTLGSYADITFGVMHSKTKLARKVDLIDPLEIEWYVSVTSGKDLNPNEPHPHIPKNFEYAGTTKNRMYVTLRRPTVSWKEEVGFNGEGSGPDNPPIQGPAEGGIPEAEAEKVRISIKKMVKDNDITLLETVLDISCRNGKGQETDEEIIKRIWADFEDREVKRRDGKLLHYWGLWGNQRADPKGGPNVWATQLVAKGTGRCGEWVYLFRDCLKAQGFKKEVVEIRIEYHRNHKRETLFEVKPHLKPSRIIIREWNNTNGKDGHHSVLGKKRISHKGVIKLFGADVNNINISGETYKRMIIDRGSRFNRLNFKPQNGNLVVVPINTGLIHFMDSIRRKYNWLQIRGEIYADIQAGDEVRGQGRKANPPSIFDGHSLIRVGGKGGIIYDPSYGRIYPKPLDIAKSIYACADVLRKKSRNGPSI